LIRGITRREMRHLARTSAALATVTLAFVACREKAAPPPPAAGAEQKPFVFSLKDLAFATAVDAKLARLSLAGSEVEAALLSRDPRERAKAGDLVAAVDAARAESDAATQQVQHPLDKPAAGKVQAAAKEYADRLVTAAKAPATPLTPELAAARATFGQTVAGYRESRAAWRFDAPPPQGAEREFAEARRDMERAEVGFMARTQVAPRDAGHEFDASGLRMAGQMGAQRAKAAAAQLSPALQPHAVRYAAAQEKVLEAVNAIQGASEADRPRFARGYHAAKAEALAALADYFAAVAAR
jgi:hypothetical protein